MENITRQRRRLALKNAIEDSERRIEERRGILHMTVDKDRLCGARAIGIMRTLVNQKLIASEAVHELCAELVSDDYRRAAEFNVASEELGKALDAANAAHKAYREFEAETEWV